MKVLFLTPWYPDERNPHYGLFVRDQAETLATRHNVTVVAARVDYQSFGLLSFRKELSVYHGIEEHRLVIPRSFPLYNQLNYLLIITWYSWQLTRSFRPEIVHANIGYPGAYWGWVTAIFARVRFVITEHVTYFKGNLRTSFHRWMTIRFMKKAAAIIAVSRASAVDIFNYVNRNSVIIPNLIAVNAFEETMTAVPGPVCHFGFLGGLNSDRKGLDILLTAASGLSRDFVLHIGGQGTLFDQYREMAKELGIESKCIFHGLIPDQQVPIFMSQLHFFVSASRGEGFGMVIAEAMACGLPVVATRSGGPEDFVNSQNGLLVPTEDAIQLKEALEQMIIKYVSFDKQAIRSFVMKRYSPGVILEMIEDVYQQVRPSKVIR